ncbi:hypothetical protein CLUG_02085 [Clavispora lusitaniae ATCC 42720]|uniref:CS domain-containing protein n=1 Tax=Clavispora lusitaniae (strain ATCC 42720) TaxID=306902 RepID=C4Y1K3_CLAL4|nr:uncharacterized protein CLUG_02085 [Clavispora lusitaniae ATCC 42720]EEQ37962.1 hypothetical protein CLUG_02085 [Clavispora lusitaniae ATCC 42720]
MITPTFSVSQDDEYIFITVKVASVRFSAQAIEMVADGDVFVFSLPPYYLRLRLPFSVVDDERSHAEFNSKTSSVDIRLPKEIRGQHFPDLDLVAKLLARKDETGPAAAAKPLIEELDVTNDVSDTAQVAQEAEAHDWEIEQTQAEAPLAHAGYGFNNAYSQLVGVSVANGNDINELGDPESAAANDRVLERLIKENIKFDPEYYAADYIMEKHPSADDDKAFGGVLAWKCPATRQFVAWYKKQQAAAEDQRETVVPVEFSPDEHKKMLELPRRSYLVEPWHRAQLLALVVSVLFAHLYDLRENEGERNIESAWTVGKLVPQFAFLDAQLHIHSEASASLLKACVVAGVRRALCYPFHRHFKVAMKTWDDVYYVLRGGKRMVLRELLHVKELFRFHDVYYVYDKIWLDDLCSWLISDAVSEGALRQLAHDVRKETAGLRKEDITFEKVDDTQTGDEMVVLDVAEVEAMADDSYAAYVAN